MIRSIIGGQHKCWASCLDAGLTVDDIDPVTDPTKKHKLFGRKVDVARADDNPDVLQYRHSHGICPEHYRVSLSIQTCSEASALCTYTSMQTDCMTALSYSGQCRRKTATDPSLALQPLRSQVQIGKAMTHAAHGAREDLANSWPGTQRLVRFVSSFPGIPHHKVPCQHHVHVAAKARAAGPCMHCNLSWWSCCPKRIFACSLMQGAQLGLRSRPRLESSSPEATTMPIMPTRPTGRAQRYATANGVHLEYTLGTSYP